MPNATVAQILANHLARDAVRAEAISVSAAVASARNLTSASAGGVGFAAPVMSGLAQGSGDYFGLVGVGEPTAALLVLDTGGDVVWLQCATCRRCYAQSGPGAVQPAGSLWRGPAAAALPCNSDLGGGDAGNDEIPSRKHHRLPFVDLGLGQESEVLYGKEKNTKLSLNTIN